MTQALVAAPISDLTDQYTVLVLCDDAICTHNQTFKPSELLRLLGDAATYQDITRRMRCTKCARRPAGIRVIWAADAHGNMCG